MKIQSLSEENVTNEVSVNPTDCNSCQTFPVIGINSVNCLRILFEEMNDFYGRIVIYGVDIIGNKLLWKLEKNSSCSKYRTTRGTRLSKSNWRGWPKSGSFVWFAKNQWVLTRGLLFCLPIRRSWLCKLYSMKGINVCLGWRCERYALLSSKPLNTLTDTKKERTKVQELHGNAI